MSQYDSTKGWLIIFERDDAKQLFGAPDDDALQSVIESKMATGQGRRVLSLDGIWKSLHGCLCDGDANSGAGDFPLNQCILGGRSLASGRAFQAFMIRPDVVQHIVAEFERSSPDRFEQAFQKLINTGETEASSWPVHAQALEKIKQCFTAAAELRAAMVFFVSQ